MTMFLYILFILPSYLKIGPRIRVGAPTRVLDSARCSLLPWLGVAELSTHHCADGLADFRELACHLANDTATGSNQPMRQKETLLRQSTGEKI
jgi:hypothetical protein